MLTQLYDMLFGTKPPEKPPEGSYHRYSISIYGLNKVPERLTAIRRAGAEDIHIFSAKPHQTHTYDIIYWSPSGKALH